MLEIHYRKTSRQTRMVDGRKITTEVTEEGKKPLTVPKRWSMFTDAGNKRLTKIAQDAFDKCKAIVEKRTESNEYDDRRDVQKILVNMLYKWRRMGDYKSYGEASDTAVRECIGDFHDKLWDATVGDYYGCQSGYDVWEKHLDKAWWKKKKFNERKKGE